MRTIAITMALSFLAACSNSLNENFHEFEQAGNFDFSTFNIVLFIPAQGCSLCIESVIGFYKNNHKNENIAFVFSYYKPLDKKLSILIQQQEGINTFSDKKYLAVNYKLVTTGAVVYFLNNGEVIERKDFLSIDIEKLKEKSVL